MSGKKEANLTDNQLKSKLNDIWTEVQTNLPSINFDDEFESNSENQVTPSWFLFYWPWQKMFKIYGESFNLDKHS